MLEAINNFDIGILEFIYENLRTPFFDVLFKIVTHFGDAMVFIIGALILVCFKKTRKAGMMFSVALVLGLLVCNCGLKPLVARIRPYEFVGKVPGVDIDILISKIPSDFSFPSGHTIAWFEAATVAMLIDKKWGIPAVIMALTVSFSRLYIFVHYPTDVFCSVVLGIGFGILGYFIVKKYYDTVSEKAVAFFKNRKKKAD